MKDLLIIPYAKRIYKWPAKGPNRPFCNDDELFGWMINDWICNQPDYRSLMTLFIRLNFNLNDFIIAVGPGGGPGSRKKKAA